MYYAFPEYKLLHFADTLRSDSLSVVRVSPSPWVVGWVGRLRSDTKLPRGKRQPSLHSTRGKGNALNPQLGPVDAVAAAFVIVFSLALLSSPLSFLHRS